MEMNFENQNWIINHMWDDADGNPTQWIFDKGEEFPYYIDYIEAIEKYEVTHKYRRLYQSNLFDNCVRFIERIKNDF